jgi:NAD-dependent deacetylase
MLQNDIDILKNWISESDNIVFFGGAGVSTESNIPDFRSVDGLYHIKYSYPPETILSHSFFMEKTKAFYEFYKDKMIYLNAEPNITHRKLAALEEAGKLKGIITQNIDGLHQKAGSKNVVELHGSVHRNYCMKCGMFYDLPDIIEDLENIPKCHCGGIIKPDVVLYEENLNEKTMKDALKLINQAEVIIIGGTSLSVYPAAGLSVIMKGTKWF